MLFYFFFFFSSRRRHTRFSRDWSSDVCSSDLTTWRRAKARLQVVVPFTILIVFVLLYLNFRRVTETLIIMLSVPFSLLGGLWLMWWLGFNVSVAVAVRFIAL